MLLLKHCSPCHRRVPHVHVCAITIILYRAYTIIRISLISKMYFKSRKTWPVGRKIKNSQRPKRVWELACIITGLIFSVCFVWIGPYYCLSNIKLDWNFRLNEPRWRIRNCKRNKRETPHILTAREWDSRHTWKNTTKPTAISP